MFKYSRPQYCNASDAPVHCLLKHASKLTHLATVKKPATVARISQNRRYQFRDLERSGPYHTYMYKGCAQPCHR